MELTNKSSVWDFIQIYYPKYHGSSDIALSDDLSKLLYDQGDIEEDDHSYRLLHDTYSGDINNPQIGRDYDELMKEIYELSIGEYLKTLK